MKSNYLTTDLEIKHKGEMAELIQAFEQKEIMFNYDELEDGIWLANISAPNSLGSPSECILVFCKYISQFNGKAKDQWQNAIYKNFNIGFEVSNDHWGYESHVSNEAVKEAAKHNSGISITLYPL